MQLALKVEKPETITNVSVEEKATEENQLDAIIVEIGQFGRFQITNYLLLCLPIICRAFYSISYVFTAGEVSYRCNITQCDGLDTGYDEPFLNFTTPLRHGAWDQCEHFAVISDLEGTTPCNASSFNVSHQVPCDAGFKMLGDEQTIASEFGIFCADQWKLSMVGTVNNIGQFVGMPLGGYMADRYGRKFMLVVSGALSAFAGLARSNAPEYYSFLSLEFVDMVVGSTLYQTAFLMAVELVGPKHRVVAATGISLTFGLADALLGYLANYLRNWRFLLRALYVPALLHLTFICLLPESVRWLLSQEKELDAKAALRRAARVNRRALDEEKLNALVRSNRRLVAQSSASRGHYSVRQIYQALGGRTALCCFVWLTNSLIDLGLSLNSTHLRGNKFDNFSMTGLMQLPGILMATTLMNWVGRRWALSSFQFSCVTILLAVAATDEDYPLTSSILFFLAKLTSSASIMILYFFTSEMFPTSCRNSVLSLCTSISFLGAMLAPQTILLIDYFEYAPHLLFATLGFTCSGLSLLFPETNNKVLPTTLAEARALGKCIPKEKDSKSSV
ncbi:organic cation transporter 1-like [Drosophila ficusphila]|uniref:organic cation transporter 1-like n=1 Tax=Drosophila ficusphila TaxID=30025 RepID=UPI0007E7C9EE|nr:organic cation transporter 1-like [Drosophila ficusphila]XP_017049196.1 organic cation transporter 1-like [Drosophila ficusphila]